MKRVACFCLLGMLVGVTPSARGGTKEELVRLQNDVLALTNQIRMLERIFTEQTQSLNSLVGQLNDQVGKSNVILTKISSTLENQAESEKSTNQNLLKEVRNLTSKIDDTGMRISALAQQVSEIKVESKPLTQRRFQTLGSDPASAALSADAIFYEAYNDLIQGNFDLAVQGFTSFVATFPSSEKADDAQYYIGEAYYNENKMPQAIAGFTKVLNDYSSGDKVASALYKRGMAELAISEKDNAVEDFKAVVQRFPNSSEAGLARSELQRLGIDPAKLPKTGTGRRKP